MRLTRLCSSVYWAFAVAAACGGDAADLARAPTPMPTDLAGFYAGDFPCGNCARIAAALWLREDGVFFFRQRYANSSADDTVSHGLGRWRWDADAALLVLESAGPERRFRHDANGRLELETASPLPHVLARAADEPFADGVRIDGLAVATGDGATLVECLSGLALPVAAGGASADLRRLYGRLVTPGSPALVSVEVRLLAGDGTEERWLVERLLNLRPQGTC
jgi:hypothetical protein